MQKLLVPAPTPHAEKIADPHRIENILLAHKPCEKPPEKFHVYLKNGQCLYGWPRKVTSSPRSCSFICEYDNADRIVNFEFSDIDFIAVS